MGRPIEIPIIADVDAFIRGTSNVAEALDEVSDSLDDVGKAGSDAGDKAGEGLSDGVKQGVDEIERFISNAADDIARRFGEGLEAGRPYDKLIEDAQRATREVAKEADQMADQVKGSAEEMERAFKDAFDAADKGSGGGSPFKKIGNDADEGFDKARKGVDDFKQSSQESAEEVASSFDGSFESIGDGAQEVLSEAFAGFGPAGAAAGLAAAAGLGVVIGAFQKAKEEAQESRDRIGDLVGTFLDVGAAGSQELGSIAERLGEVAAETEEGKRSIADWQELAHELGLAWTDVARAVGGDMEATREVLAGLAEEEERLIEIREREIALGDEASSLRTSQTEEQLEQNRSIQEDLKGIQTEWETARAQEQAYYEAGVAANPDHKEAIQDMADDIVGVSDAWSTAFGVITEDGKITYDELNTSLDQLLADQANKIEVYTWAQRNLTEEQVLALESFGEDRAAVIETLMNTPPELRQQALDKLQTAGNRMAQAQTQGFIKGMPREIGGPNVRFNADTSGVEKAIGSLQKRSVIIDVRPRFLDQLN